MEEENKTNLNKLKTKIIIVGIAILVGYFTISSFFEDSKTNNIEKVQKNVVNTEKEKKYQQQI